MANDPSDAILRRLLHLHPKLIDLSLTRTMTLLKALGNPHHHLPPVVHVAGTNGKGSILAMLRAILEQAGLKVHVYTSPHLVKFSERIRLAGKLISEDHLNRILANCEKRNAGQPITFFEITTCAAFQAFAETPADILLLETGLGGRLDSTNVIAKPAATIIAAISMDHAQFLGDTLAAIAHEKAWIQKPQVPSIIGPQDADVMAVCKNIAQKQQAYPFIFGEDWQIDPTDTQQMRFQSSNWDLILPRPNLMGHHQITNAGMAVACLDRLANQGLSIEAADIATGLQQIDWPARLQRLTQGVIKQKLGHDWEVWLDGGHNAAAGAALAATMHAWQQSNTKPLQVIFGMLNTRDAGEFLAPLRRITTKAYAVEIPDQPNSLTALEICQFGENVGLSILPATNLDAALSQIAQNPPGRLLICGSLYLAGKVLEQNQ